MSGFGTNVQGGSITDSWDKLKAIIETTNRRAEDTTNISPRFAIKSRLLVPPSMDNDHSIAEYFDHLQKSLFVMLVEIEAICGATIFAETNGKIRSLAHDVFVIMYDIIGSSNEPEPLALAEQRNILSSVVIQVAQTLGEEDCVATGDDGNAFVVHGRDNVLPLLDALYEGFTKAGVCGRVSIVSTARRERPLLNETYHTYTGSCFVLGARIRDHYQKEPWIKDGKSHTFVDEHTFVDMQGLGVRDRAFRKLTSYPIELRGKALARTDIFEYMPHQAPPTIH